MAGAIATGTHGSGTGNLATAVRALQLVTSTGDIVEAERGDPDFDGMVVHLGRLGVVTRLTLDTEPYYEVSQRVFEGLSWEHVPDVFDAAYSVSVFTRWDAASTGVAEGPRARCPRRCSTRRPATVERHPIIELDPVNCTRQLGVPGPWWDRLPHFRMGFTPSKGDELQAEYLLPRERAVEAIRALRAADACRACSCRELRTVARRHVVDEPACTAATRSPCTSRSSRCRSTPRCAEIEAALAPFDPRPHPGKVHLTPGRYERAADFDALAERLDPRGAFRPSAAASSSSTTGDSGGGSRLDVVEHDGHDPGHRDGEEHADDPAEDAAGRERDHDHRRVQVHGAAHQHRVQHVPLDLLDDDDRAEHERRVEQPAGDERDQHGDEPGQERADQAARRPRRT